MDENVARYIVTHSKRQGVGFALTLFFGPLGLFYSSWVAALILCVIAVTTATSLIGPIACWVVSMFISISAVAKHNEKVKAAAMLGIRE